MDSMNKYTAGGAGKYHYRMLKTPSFSCGNLDFMWGAGLLGGNVVVYRFCREICTLWQNLYFWAKGNNLANLFKNRWHMFVFMLY